MGASPSQGPSREGRETLQKVHNFRARAPPGFWRLEAEECRALVRYTAAVRSVADDLRAESRQRGARLSPSERFQLALTLGDADVELLSAARALSRDEAIEVIRRTRCHGRRRSVSSEGHRP